MEKLFDIYMRLPVLAHTEDDLELIVRDIVKAGLMHIQANPLLKASDDITIVEVRERDEDEEVTEPDPPPLRH